MNKIFFMKFSLRFLLLISVLFASVGMYADGFTPSDGGLVVNLKPGDQILLSVWVDKNGNGIEEQGEEFFVCNYPQYTGGYFNYKYKKGTTIDSLRLIPQNHLATEPSSTSIWEIDTALVRPTNEKMGGICYTMWNYCEANDKRYTLYVGNSDLYKTQGRLTNNPTGNANKDHLADVVFVVPTNAATTSFDPDSTLGRGPKFSAVKGFGFLGMPYREVYWLDIAIKNEPISYINASVLGFNTTLSNYSYSNGQGTAQPGQLLYAFANDSKHNGTQRTLFRLYVLDETTVSACPEANYYFAYSQRFRQKYRKGPWTKAKPTAWTVADSTGLKSAVTMDRLSCMERIPGTKYYQTDYMHVPDLDSARYYVGYKNHFAHKTGKNPAPFEAAYTYVDSLPIQYLASRFKAPKGAFGRMIIDTTKTDDAYRNLDVCFRPAGMFIKAETGRNIEMTPEEGDTSWISVEKWHVEDAYGEMEFKAMIYTGEEFSSSDPGMDIPGWSIPVKGKNVPLVGGGSVIGKDGWCRVYVNKSTPNGGLEFVEADPDKYVRYYNNGHYGDTIATGYPRAGQTKMVIQAPRLLAEYDFAGWNTAANGSGRMYQAGDTVNLDTIPEKHITLYAQAEYKGNIRVAISFMQGGKRYFLTHPGVAPRFATARHFDDWTNTWQGMANVDNVEPEYMSTYLIIGNNTECAECSDGEYVLDPKRETMKGAEDSVTFYEHFNPESEEYIGLYYTDPNTVIANNTWAGLFQSSEGWPDPTRPCIDSTKLFSTHYLHRVAGKITKDPRPNNAQSYIKYAPSANGNFNGVAAESDGTDFTISGVGVVDAHYVVLPDTLRSDQRWVDEIVFDYHSDTHLSKQVWSKLIGKQLMMQMQLGDETVYFHPNNAKTCTTPNQLALSRDFRLTQSFEYIRDRRVETVDDEDRPHMTESTSDFCRMINSGLNTPIDVIYNGQHIDIVDTIRVTLRTGANRIKAYYGIWKDGAPGLHIRPDGSRYRDILVITKTYHHGPEVDSVMLTPEYPSYSFPPMDNVSHRINFNLAKVRVRELHDKDDHVLGVEILSSTDETESLHLQPSDCSFTGGDTYFAVTEAVDAHVTIKTKNENTSETDHDTLIVHETAHVAGKDYAVSCRVPLVQTAMELEEVVWSVVGNGKRYYITAGSGGLIFRQFELKENTLYKKEDGVTQLIKGSANAANSDTRYITPWNFRIPDHTKKQVEFRTLFGVNKNFSIDASSRPGVVDGENFTGASLLTYEYVTENFNDNGNFEEVVKIKYGDNKWLKFTARPDTVFLSLTTVRDSAATFSWTYLKPEYYLLNNEAYPNRSSLEFGYNNARSSSVQTRYKAYRIYSMMVNNRQLYCGRVDEADMADLIHSGKEWKTRYSVTLIRDGRFASGASGLSYTLDSVSMTTTVTPAGDSPTGIKYPAGTGPYVNIVDTLDVQLSLQNEAPHYGFKGEWAGYASVNDAHLKIPLVRKTYHTVPYDSLLCTVDRDEYTFVFPPEVSTGVNDEHTFSFRTVHYRGTNTVDVDGQVVAYSNVHSDNHTSDMDFTVPAKTEIRLMDEYGATPDWCEISRITAHEVTIRCKGNGIRAPRSANIYLAYVIEVEEKSRYVNFMVQVMQASRFQYSGHQNLVHSKGASGAPLKDGVQQVHEHRNIIYYYNPSNRAQSTDQRVELPLRERNFYGWWRWYSLEKGKEDTDIPAAKWQTPPMNTGRYNFPYRTIGDSVKVPNTATPDPDDSVKVLVTQGRYTVFHVPSKDYGARKDPPAKAPMVYPPQNKDTVVYALDMSVYYDNLPLSMKYVGQVDTAIMDKLEQIIEPTLSLREIYELHPWTEMAERLEGYKSPVGPTYSNEKYLEDHTVMAPIKAPLLLTTEQHYNYDSIKSTKHSESLMGYYMRDDNWSDWSDNNARLDSMIWCAGWDVPCGWYIYNPGSKTYDTCTHKITSNEFLQVPRLSNIPSDKEADTVIYCLRSRSVKSTFASDLDGAAVTEVPGDYWFNICRYTIIYHRPEKYGPKAEAAGKAIITNDEIEQHFDILQRLNFDYNKPGEDYTVYPHPLPWADASYGFAYPMTDALPDNRPHNAYGLTNLANMGEYNIINRIPSYGTYWHKMEQHGGAANGYMIYCDGMSSAGQVAALHLDTTLCEGQKMYFSAYVANPSNENGKSCPNFLFSVQGSMNDTLWEDITSYMTGDIPADKTTPKWYQIYFPIEQKKEYQYFRIKVSNMASNDDGNDFLLDDMCVFSTKPPLMVYQANTTCKSTNESDSLTHIVLRLDYQGFTDDVYDSGTQYYTIQQITKSKDSTFLELADTYYNQDTKPHIAPATVDTVYGWIKLPMRSYTPTDSIFPNLQELIAEFEASLTRHTLDEDEPVLRGGYVFEHLDDSIRPVMYIVHSAKMSGENSYVVHMANTYSQLMSSRCALTRALKVRNRMILTLNGNEQAEKEVTGMCPNSLYDVSLMVKGTLMLDSVAPIEVSGSCYNDWLLYGDTAEATSVVRYGYKYSDIAKMISILRADDTYGTNNTNHFARSFVDVNKNVMYNVQHDLKIGITGDVHPYDILKHLVEEGFLTMYKSDMSIVTPVDDSIKYTIFPIPGSGSEVLTNMNVDVCPTPVQISLRSSAGHSAPMVIGGLNRPEEEEQYPIDILANVETANTSFKIPIDSLMMKSDGTSPEVVLKQITFLSTNDPNYRPGIDTIILEPDRAWDLGGTNIGYYTNGNDTLVVVPAEESTYRMIEGYSYSFGIEMMTSVGASKWGEGVEACSVGTVPFTVNVVPNHLRWDPQTTDNRWNNPDNWIGITQDNIVIHNGARFAPLQSSYVIIPPMTDGKPYPVLPASISSSDSIQQVGFQYNTCRAIRFLPGAALSQQQRLEYDSVIADLSTPYDKWALRSAPVEGLLSGDIFMSNADLTWETPNWSVGPFDAAGRNYNTGNASFWLSLYSSDALHQTNGTEVDTMTTTAATWSKVTNVLSLPLNPAQGWAVYTRTRSGRNADVRLPKKDDIYYYYTKSGEKVHDLYESGQRAKRAENAGGAEKVGKLAFYPGKAVTNKSYTLSNGTAATTFVFGNPTMGYIDIWGFISDNTAALENEISYMNSLGEYTTITYSGLSEDIEDITSLSRYLPPMHAMVLKKKGAATTSLDVTLKTSRIIADASQRAALATALSAPRRAHAGAVINKGIMTVTAVNPVSPRCTSKLLLGQGFNNDIIRGEDAVLTTINIDNFSLTAAPATPFNIYAVEGNNGLSIDLRNDIVNVPLSFYNSELPFDPVSYLWFTGVNAIDGELVLYDAFTGTEQLIRDGICLEIETPEVSHEVRYFIRRQGYNPYDPGDDHPITTGTENTEMNHMRTLKLLKDGHVLILRDGHVYTIFGQKIR